MVANIHWPESGENNTQQELKFNLYFFYIYHEHIESVCSKAMKPLLKSSLKIKSCGKNFKCFTHLRCGELHFREQLIRLIKKNSCRLNEI